MDENLAPVEEDERYSESKGLGKRDVRNFLNVC